MSLLKFKDTNGEWQTITGTSSVVSFNGRAGAIKPRAGDYTAEMVGADEAGAASQALEDAKAYTDNVVGSSNVTCESIGALPTTGGTMTGNLEFGTTRIYWKVGPNAQAPYIGLLHADTVGVYKGKPSTNQMPNGMLHTGELSIHQEVDPADEKKVRPGQLVTTATTPSVNGRINWTYG